jgi:hypothetical protein
MPDSREEKAASAVLKRHFVAKLEPILALFQGKLSSKL